MKVLVTLVSIFIATCSQWVHADIFGSGADTFNIEFVTIGNPGNAADTTGNPNLAGNVDYAYRIGKFEISEQMIVKANMQGGVGITKDTRGPDKPATGISWNEAARFVNWLNTSKDFSPAYKFALQPGNAGYAVNANAALWALGDPGFDPANPYRNSLAKYFLPSSHEWYKAAYYDPSKDAYYDYPIGSDIAPTSVGSGTAAGTAVYNQPFTIGPADIAVAGGLSSYGTMAQGGNVHEWEETDSDLVNDSTSSARGFRGGYWISGSFVLSSLGRSILSPAGQFNDIGFRVASIPEPSTLLLTIVAFIAMIARRRRSIAITP